MHLAILLRQVSLLFATILPFGRRFAPPTVLLASNSRTVLTLRSSQTWALDRTVEIPLDPLEAEGAMAFLELPKGAKQSVICSAIKATIWTKLGSLLNSSQPSPQLMQVSIELEELASAADIDVSIPEYITNFEYSKGEGIALGGQGVVGFTQNASINLTSLFFAPRPSQYLISMKFTGCTARILPAMCHTR